MYSSLPSFVTNLAHATSLRTCLPHSHSHAGDRGILSLYALADRVSTLLLPLKYSHAVGMLPVSYSFCESKTIRSTVRTATGGSAALLGTCTNIVAVSKGISQQEPLLHSVEIVKSYCFLTNIWLDLPYPRRSPLGLILRFRESLPR